MAWAIRSDEIDFKLCFELIKKGADPYYKLDDDACAPLTNAIMHEQWSAAKKLLDIAPLRHTECEIVRGYSPLLRACYSMCYSMTTSERDWQNPKVNVRAKEMVELLITAGADLDVVCDHGWNAMSMFIGHGSLEMVNRLIKAGAKLDHQQAEVNPLWVCLGNDIDNATSIAWALLSAGANPDAKMTIPESCDALEGIEGVDDQGNPTLLTTPRKAIQHVSATLCDVFVAWGDYKALREQVGPKELQGPSSLLQKRL